MRVPNPSASNNREMNTAGTVIGVLIALGFVIFISALAAAYVLWKDGCCKRRKEERNEETEGIISCLKQLQPFVSRSTSSVLALIKESGSSIVALFQV